jgi:hypothetical protein
MNVPRFQKNTPEALASRVTAVAFSRITGSATPIRLLRRLSNSLSFMPAHKKRSRSHI